MDFGINLLQIEHHQIGVVKQNHRECDHSAGTSRGVEAGVDIVGFAGHKPIADKFVLQQRFAAGSGYAATAGGAQIMAVGNYLLITSSTLNSCALSVRMSQRCRGYGNKGSASGSLA